MRREFPPRSLAASWPATRASRDTVVSEAMACSYAGAENSQSRHFRRLGVLRMLDWLEAQPGSSWQDRWHAGCRAAAAQDWRDVAERWLKDAGRIADGNRAVWQSLGGALGLLIGRDVIRPDLGWLLASATPAHLAADMARVRDPAGFAALEEAAGPASVSISSTRRAMLQVAVIMAVKGGLVSAMSPSGTAWSGWRPVRAPRETAITEEPTSTSCCTRRVSCRRAPRPGRGCSTRASAASCPPGS